MNTMLRRTGAIASVSLILSLGLTACGDDSDDSTGATSEPTTSTSTDTSSDAGVDTFGPGCSAIPSSGKGSFNGMATDPVATAASNNPLLKTLVTAVKKAGLVDTLNSADGITVFAPTDDAFGKIPSDTLNQVLADKDTLTKILTHHVISGQLSPDEIAGEHETLAGDKVDVTGNASDGVTVATDGGPAKVLCGNIPTANATVYVIDTVLMPAS